MPVEVSGSYQRVPMPKRLIRFLASITYLMVSPLLVVAEEIDGNLFSNPDWMFIDDDMNFLSNCPAWLDVPRQGSDIQPRRSCAIN